MDFRDGVLNRLAEPVLRDYTRAQHRNLLLVGSLSILIAQLNLVPTRISALGVDLHSGDRNTIRVALLLAVAYLTVAYVAAAIVDYASWQSLHGEGRAMSARVRQIINETREEIDARLPALQSDPDRTTSGWQDYESKLQQLADAQRRDTLYRLFLPVYSFQGFLDFGVPLAISVAAIIELALHLV